MDVLEVITEPHRRAILALVWDDELSAGDIADNFDVTFGAVSQHLKTLRDAGLVTMRKDGNKRMYRVDKDGIRPFREVLEAMWTTGLDNLAQAVERDDT
ncbi:MAG: winged helix-turn-helix transcriptional regulator [Acidobacteria bacterium]|nr:winged helix-turn-helix transcriptional regulator [Acidobacteriota bacterium]